MKLKYPDFELWLEERNIDENPFENEDISYLYWISVAYGGLISSSQGNPIFVVDLPRVGWLLEKSMEVDESWNSGALYSAMISYTMSRPDAVENREQVAREYFEKATNVSQQNDCSTFIRFAESVCVRNQNKEEFVEKLEYVLNYDVNSSENLKLSNTMAQSRAKWLMERIDDLFY